MREEQTEVAQQILKMFQAITKDDVLLSTKDNKNGTLSVCMEYKDEKHPPYMPYLHDLKDAGLEIYKGSKHAPLEVIVPANSTGLAQTFKAMEKIVTNLVANDIINVAYTLPEDRQAEFRKRVLTAIAKEIGVDSLNKGKAIPSRG